MTDEAFSPKRLVKLLGMTTSAVDAEALAAIRKANAELTKLGKTWDEFVSSRITIVEDPFGAIPTPPQGPAPDIYTWGSSATAPHRRTSPAPPPPPPPPRPWPQPKPPRPKATPDPWAQSSGAPASGATPRVNDFAGQCKHCKERVAARDGHLIRDGKYSDGRTRWSVVHRPGKCPQPQPAPKPRQGTLDDFDFLSN